LDLRKSGPFKGHGALLDAAREYLLDAWKSGSAAVVAEAMDTFRGNYEHAIAEQSPVDHRDRRAFTDWGYHVSEWLYGTSHIKIVYSVQYDGLDIEQLSPGTRGIVLLLLYLSIDHDDVRPLLIDQPEENLDPKSIFDELVGRFRDARRRRQIIIVTHNANLIVNTDADQVIVAKAGPHRKAELPAISYQSGGLENPTIRREVCEVLEGGEDAFRQRAKRLRIEL
jgi:predicted ATPase